MNIVIRSVTCHDQADRRHMEASRTVGISMARRNTHELLTFKLNSGSSELLRNRKCRIDLPQEIGFSKTPQEREVKVAFA